MKAAHERNAQWDALEASLAAKEGELQGTRTELAETRTLFDKTQAHALEMQRELQEAQQHVDRLKQQLGGVESLKNALALAYKDLETCKDKFSDAMADFNAASTAANSLHLFEF